MKHPILTTLGLGILLAVIIFVLIRPSNTRDWSEDQAVLPYAEFKDNEVTIHNIRNFRYTSTTNYTKDYYDKTFDLEKIKSVDYIVEPFAGFGSAHTFLSFGFEDGSFVSISVEIRKEKGESFSPWKGLLKRYELMYVVADERDVIELRANHRKDSVYLYPIITTLTKIKMLFVDMLTKANELTVKPEFYNTLTNNCTTNIIDHVNTISPKKIPWSFKTLFPASSDRLAYDIGLIDKTAEFTVVRYNHKINDKAAVAKDDPNFSELIRRP